LTKEIAEAKKIEQGKKTEEAFNTLKEAIKAAEETLNTARDQEALNQGVTTLKAAVKAFKESADKEVAQQPKPSNPSYPIFHRYNKSTKVSTSRPSKKTEIKKQEVKEEPKKQEVKKENLNQERFTDTKGHWAKEAINYVVEKGYFAGVSAREFAPNKAITRGQLVTVLGRILNINKTSFKSNNFKDVKSDAYYAPYIAWAESVGITKGRGNGNFDPDKEITREEMAVMMVKFLKISGKNINAKGKEVSFKDDGNIESWAKDAVREMAKLGLVSGMEDGSFSPKTEFTRAQVAQVLYKMDKN
uniref:S-layer homology domain-containing protein n=1 Tax=Peptoniphilus vaginalis TaxID=1756987 RepID=UPI0023F9CD82